MTTIQNIKVTRISLAGEDSIAIQQAKAGKLLKALTQISASQNVYDPQGSPCAVAMNFRMQDGSIMADIDLSNSSQAKRANEISAKYDLCVRLAGVASKRAYESGTIYGPDILGLSLVLKTEQAVTRSIEIAKTMFTIGNGAGRTFSMVVNDYASKGVANPFAKALLTHPDLYNAYREGFSSESPMPAKRTSRHALSTAQAYVNSINRLPQHERGAAILRLARKEPQAYSEARSQGLL